MMKILGTSVTFSIYILINAIILYGLIASIFFEIDSALCQIENSIDNDDNSKTTNDTQQQLETQCKSPCPPNIEMCIQMCA